MLKKSIFGMMMSLSVFILVVVMLPLEQINAQGARSIVPVPRITIETIDPATGMAKSTYCIGVNTIDIKLTNSSGYGQYVSVINHDTRGAERTLFSGHVPTGVSYLSRLLGSQLALTGPVGTETLRIVSNASAGTSSQGQATGSWVSYYVQECGAPAPSPMPMPGPAPGPGYYAQIWAQAYPYAVEQGKKSTITLQTSVGSQPNTTYYFEILNSWGQLWKRIPVVKHPYDRYQVTLPVGKATKPGVLTYTVNLLVEFAGQHEKIASTQFSFQVVTAGSLPQTPYNPGYPGWPAPYGTDPYSGMPGYGVPMPAPVPLPYGAPPYNPYSPYGKNYLGGPQGERQVK
jgi:hypothetical protein